MPGVAVSAVAAGGATLRARALALLALLALLLAPHPARAADEVLLANLAQIEGEVTVVVDGARHALTYRSFRLVPWPRGTARVQVYAGADRALLDTSLELRTTDPFRPTLYLVGNGRTRAFELIGEDASSLPASVKRPVLDGFFYRNASSMGLSGNVVTRCIDDSPSADYGTFLADEGRFTTVSAYGADRRCRMDLAFRGGPSFHLEADTLPAAIYRFVVVGDGSTEFPYELLALRDAEILASAAVNPPQPGAVLMSPDFWFDMARPAQGLVIYETGPSTQYGMWYTYDAVGAPTWFLLDGQLAELAGRRDVTILRVRPATATEPQVLQPVGTGRLVYTDCNEAEFRAVMGDDVRVLSVRRAERVARCVELN